MRQAVWGDGCRSPGLSLGLAPAGAENHQLLTVAGVMVHVGTAIGPLPKVDRAIREAGDNGFNLVHLGKKCLRNDVGTKNGYLTFNVQTVFDVSGGPS